MPLLVISLMLSVFKKIHKLLQIMNKMKRWDPKHCAEEKKRGKVSLCGIIVLKFTWKKDATAHV